MSNTILPCPNPECGSDDISICEGGRYGPCAACGDCGYCGPTANNAPAAVAAHNRLASAVADRDRLAAENEALRAQVAQLREALVAWETLRNHEILCGMYGEDDVDAEITGDLKGAAIDLTLAALAATAPATGEEPSR